MEHSFTVVILIEVILLFHEEVLLQLHEYYKIQTTKIVRFYAHHFSISPLKANTLAFSS